MYDLFATLAPHDEVDAKLLGGDRRMFVSDWNGGHPFLADYLGPLGELPYLRWGRLGEYSEMEYDDALKSKIATFHAVRDGREYRSSEVYPGAGSASFLATVCLWLRERLGGQEVYYLPPLYYNLTWWLKRLGRDVLPASSGPVLDDVPELALPDRRSVLVLTDPLWYAGRHLPAAVLAQVRDWQQRTGSLVFVDGTFQYLSWNSSYVEPSATLLPDLTVRLVCPTKALAIHGCRFAYLLAGADLLHEIGELHGNLHGPASLADRVFAHRAMDVLASERSNRQLTDFVQANYRRLVEAGALVEQIVPELGYFVFGRPVAPPESFLALGQECYGLSDYPGYVRVNLCKEPALDFLIAQGRRS